ncbi:MAG: imidazole glycerol phosphate synthase subunit HisH [Acidobacteriota bacterium]
MRVVVVDSGVGNVPNAVRGLQRAGASVSLTRDAREVAGARRVVVPGVGAFPAAVAALEADGLVGALRAAVAEGAAVLGICLGHQLLFESSEEFGASTGLGVLPGRVRRLPPEVRVPHMGWSRLRARREDPLLDGLGDGAWMYFVHSFAAEPGDENDTLADVELDGHRACAAVRRGRVCGVQFHPEKSGAAGARLLRNFLERV